MRKAILHLKKADPVLASVIERVGAYRIEYRDPDFQTLVRSIVYQQLSGRVARVIFDRLAALLPEGKITPAAHFEAHAGQDAARGLVEAKDRLHSRSGAENGAREGAV